MGKHGNRERPRIALACSADLTRAGGTGEDRALAAALRHLGLAASLEAWDAEIEWRRRFDAVLVRSCWDYHLRPEAFRSWLDGLEMEGLRVWNPPALIRWNLDKRYLRELAAREVPVVPTFYLEGGAAAGLEAWLGAQRAESLVVKPAVGASAHGCRRIEVEPGTAERLAGLATAGPWLVQPFVEEVVREGEWSLVWLCGALRHSVVKRPRPEDFRVQSELGGTVERRQPDEGLVEVARRAVAALSSEPLFARVDMVRLEGEPRLMELELIEPELYLSPGDPGLAILAREVASRLA